MPGMVGAVFYDDRHLGDFGLNGSQYRKKCDKCSSVFTHGARYKDGGVQYDPLRDHGHWLKTPGQMSRTYIATDSLWRWLLDSKHVQAGFYGITNRCNAAHGHHKKEKSGRVWLSLSAFTHAVIDLILYKLGGGGSGGGAW